MNKIRGLLAAAVSNYNFIYLFIGDWVICMAIQFNKLVYGAFVCNEILNGITMN